MIKKRTSKLLNGLSSSVRAVTLLFTLPSLPSFFGFYFTLLLPSFWKNDLLYFTFTEFLGKTIYFLPSFKKFYWVKKLGKIYHKSAFPRERNNIVHEMKCDHYYRNKDNLSPWDYIWIQILRHCFYLVFTEFTEFFFDFTEFKMRKLGNFLLYRVLKKTR